MKKLYCLITVCFIFISSISTATAVECSYENNIVTCEIRLQHGSNQVKFDVEKREVSLIPIKNNCCCNKPKVVKPENISFPQESSQFWNDSQHLTQLLNHAWIKITTIHTDKAKELGIKIHPKLLGGMMNECPTCAMNHAPGACSMDQMCPACATHHAPGACSMDQMCPACATHHAPGVCSMDQMCPACATHHAPGACSMDQMCPACATHHAPGACSMDQMCPACATHHAPGVCSMDQMCPACAIHHAPGACSMDQMCPACATHHAPGVCSMDQMQ